MTIPTPTPTPEQIAEQLRLARQWQRDCEGKLINDLADLIEGMQRQLAEVRHDDNLYEHQEMQIKELLKRNYRLEAAAATAREKALEEAMVCVEREADSYSEGGGFYKILRYVLADIRALASTPLAPVTPEAWKEGWQPIETAPKDGTPILGYMPDDGLIYVLVWKGVSPDCGYWEEADGEQYATYEPTHFMPLPSPPAGKKP